MIAQKNYRSVKHSWLPTERSTNGVLLRFHACATCMPAHLKAYDMTVINPGAFQGSLEYEARSKHT